MLTYINTYIHTFNVYSLCNKKGKVSFVIQYNFNFAVSSPLESVNANHILYGSEDFSSCFSNVVSDFLMNKINFVGGDKLLPVFKHGFLRSEENVFPANFLHTKCVWENIFLYNFQYLCMVGIITIHVGRCYCLILPNTLCFWQMLLPWQMLLQCFVCCFFY